MISRLDTRQVTENWGMVKGMLMESVPYLKSAPESKLNNILKEIINGKMDIWSVFEYGQDFQKIQVHALGASVIVIEPVSLTKNILIYGFTGSFFKGTEKFWRKSWESFEKYEKKNNCENIIAFTESEKIVEMARFVGVKISYSLTKEVK